MIVILRPVTEAEIDYLFRLAGGQSKTPSHKLMAGLQKVSDFATRSSLKRKGILSPSGELDPDIGEGIRLFGTFTFLMQILLNEKGVLTVHNIFLPPDLDQFLMESAYTRRREVQVRMGCRQELIDWIMQIAGLPSVDPVLSEMDLTRCRQAPMYAVAEVATGKLRNLASLAEGLSIPWDVATAVDHACHKMVRRGSISLIRATPENYQNPALCSPDHGVLFFVGEHQAALFAFEGMNENALGQLLPGSQKSLLDWLNVALCSPHQVLDDAG